MKPYYYSSLIHIHNRRVDRFVPAALLHPPLLLHIPNIFSSFCIPYPFTPCIAFLLLFILPFLFFLQIQPTSTTHTIAPTATGFNNQLPWLATTLYISTFPSYLPTSTTRRAPIMEVHIHQGGCSPPQMKETTRLVSFRSLGMVRSIPTRPRPTSRPQ